MFYTIKDNFIGYRRNMDAGIIQESKKHIEDGNLPYLQTYVCSLMNNEELEREPDWPHIFHRVYLHACLKGKKEIAEWLQTAMYPLMDPIEQIALRQIFPYGRYLLTRFETYKATRPPS
jgi:hypothetical protein